MFVLMVDGGEQLGFGFDGGEQMVPVQAVPSRRRPRRAARDRMLIDHPQTRLKLKAYANYLQEWLRVAASQDSDVFILDLFAGPGLYQVGDGQIASGSPVIACDAAIVLEQQQQRRGRPVAVHLRFAERNGRTLGILRDVLAPYHGRLDVKERRASATDVVATFATESKGHPTLVLLDPDGYKDVPFSLVRQFSGRRFTELLISFDVQGYVRAAGLKEARSLSEFCGDDMWRQDRHPDGTIDVDRFLEGYRSRLAQAGLFRRATIRRIVFDKVHANRAIAQACGSELGVKLWKSCFVAAFEDESGVQVLDIVRQVDRRERMDVAIDTLRSLSGSSGVLFGAIRRHLDALDLDEADVHQILLFLRGSGLVSWSSRLHRSAEPAPRFSFSELPLGLRWDGLERPAVAPALQIAPRTTA